MMRIRAIPGLARAAWPAALLAAILPASLISPARADPLRVGYAAQAIIFTVPVQTGIEHGFFAAHGVEISPLMFAGGAKLHQAMLAGAVDIGMASGSDFAWLVKGSPEMVTYAVVQQPYSVGISAIDPAIRTPDDLNGKRIGVTTVGSYTYWLASELPHLLHWKTGSAIPVTVGGSIAAETAALTTGQIDAVVTDIALGLTLAQQGRGRLVLDAADIVRDVVSSAVFVHKDLLASQPDALRRFTAAMRQSLDYIAAHPDDTAATAAKESGFPLDVVRREVAIMQPGWSKDGRITQAQLRGTAVAIQQAGLLDRVVDLSPYYTDAFSGK